MAKALQRRRGTNEEHKNFTGLEGEFTYNTTEKRIVAHDGVTKGGIPLAKKAELESAKTELEGKIEQVSSSLDPRILDAASQSDILEAVSQATVGNIDAPTLEGLQAQIAANASNIASKPTPARYVTETWSSGASWYTKYSDKWVEQGGVLDAYGKVNMNVTLSVAMSTNRYTALVGPGYYAQVSQAYVVPVVGNKTTTGFTVFSNHAGQVGSDDCWYVCGYSA